ncbi:hypothetical protein ACMFMG_001290 [Clarireedia jacksonii]
MAGASLQIPLVTAQPPSVDFIQNRLPSYHKGFKSQYCQWNPDLKRFIPRPPSTAISSNDPSTNEKDVEDEQLLSARRVMPAVAAMKFWKCILPEAMNRFMLQRADEPLEGKKKDFSIQREEDWEKIYEKLQAAREKYDGGKKGFWGKFKRGTRKIFRKASEYTSVAQQALQIIPDHEIVSPVKAAVEVLLDAAERAKETREKVTSSTMAESLEKTFGDVEIFLTTFQEDDNIGEASIKLITSILIAIEDAIFFFLSHQLTRGFAVITRGKNYEKRLLDEVDDIQQKSNDLIREAERSDLVGNREAMEKILNGVGQIVYLEIQQSERIEFVIGKVDVVLGKLDETYQLVTESTDTVIAKVDEAKEEVIKNFNEMQAKFEEKILNCVQNLLREGEAKHEEKEKQLEQEYKEREKQREQELIVLRRQNQKLKDQSEHGGQDRNVPTSPPQQSLYPWQYPPPWVNGWWGPPLSGWNSYCPPGPSPTPQPSAQPPQPPPLRTLDASTLLELLDIPIVNSDDINSILESSNSIPTKYHNRAAQVVQSSQFHSWATSATSRDLLIQADIASDPAHSAEALSFVCATMAKALRQREQSVCLVFFCAGLDKFDSDQVGPVAMIRCLAAQLLSQQLMGMKFLEDDVDVDGIRNRDVEALCRLFELLVRLVSRRLTLVCLLDGITYYENPEYQSDLIEILKFIVDLSRDDTVGPAVKVLATCPVGTIEVHTVFDDDSDSCLSMAGLPLLGHDLVISNFEDSDGNNIYSDDDDN